MAQPPQKHVVDVINTGEVGAATRTVQLALGTLNPDPYTNVTNVKAGSKVTVITVQLDTNVEAPAAGHFPDYFDWFLWFNINGAQTTPRPDLVGQSHLKNQIFHQDGAIEFVSGITAANTLVAKGLTWRAHIVIPRQWQIVNDGDTIELVYRWADGTNTHDTKVKAIYKEIYP